MQLRDDEVTESIRVLVPGHGVCKVQRDYFVQTPTIQHGGGGVTSLKVNFYCDHGSSRALQQFIVLVGAPLTRLVLHLPAGGASIVPRVLKSCPDLKTLVLKNGVIDTSSFLQACRKYDLGIEELDCHFDNVCRLMKELADERSTRFAQTLKRLTYVADADDADDDGEDDEDHRTDGCTLNMLSTNRTLEYLGMAMRFEAYDSSRLENLREYDKSPLPAAREPLRLECRLTFLSIFSSSCRANNRANNGQEAKRAKASPAMPPSASTTSIVLAEFPIDRHVISLIFEFAAPCVPRRIHVQFYQ